MGFNWPATIDEAEAAGYFPAPANPKECSCGTTFRWFITPKGNWMPVSSLKDSRLVPHWTVCQRVKEFREANKKHAERTESKKPKQQELF
jgi:hypothetical protein